jgi:hypothetical protein
MTYQKFYSYTSDEAYQLFQSSRTGQVIRLERIGDGFDSMGTFVTLDEMEACNWFAIDESDYIGMPD